MKLLIRTLKISLYIKIMFARKEKLINVVKEMRNIQAGN